MVISFPDLTTTPVSYTHLDVYKRQVLAGVVEPPSATPVVVEDNVLIGANAVVIEGVRIGEGVVVAAGSVVIEDVEPVIVCLLYTS